MIGQSLAHFRIVAKLGEGGMGVVYRAVDDRLRREVALKVLPDSLAADPERRGRFLREARAAAAVTHGNIATVHDIGEVDGHLFIAMELVEGETLRERIAPGLTHAEALRVAREIAKGLARAHEGGVVHRDLKPENVMVTSAGDVKILDFGLAKLVDPVPANATDATASRKTAEGRAMGTPPYMSPEQVEGRAEIDARSDVFSFGAMLYEMLSGVRPFQGGTNIAVLYAVLHTEPQPLEVVCPGAPRVLADVVATCLKKEVGERFASGRELLVALGSESLPPGVVSSARALPAAKLVTVSGMGTALGATMAPEAFPATTGSASPATVKRGWRRPGLVALAIVATTFAVAGFRRWGGVTKGTNSPAPSASVAEDPGASRSTNAEAQRYFEEAMRSFRDGTGQAAPLLQSAVKADPGFGGAYLRLWVMTGVTSFEYWPIPEHAADYQRQVAALRETLSSRDRELFDSIDAGDVAQANASLDAYLVRHPQDVVAWWARLDGVVATKDRALAANPTVVPFLAMRAASAGIAEIASASALLARCLDLSPRAADCLYVRGYLLDVMGKCEPALSDLKRVLDLVPDARAIRPEVAGILAGQGAPASSLRLVLGAEAPGVTGDGQTVFDAIVPLFEGDF